MKDSVFMTIMLWVRSPIVLLQFNVSSAQVEEEETVRGDGGSHHVYIQDVSSSDSHYYRSCHNNYGYKLLITISCYQLSYNELNRCN